MVVAGLHARLASVMLRESRGADGLMVYLAT